MTYEADSSLAHGSDSDEEIINGAQAALRCVTELKPGENCLVIADPENEQVAGAFAEAANRLGAVGQLHLLTGSRPFMTVPDSLLEELQDQSVFVNIFRSLGDETPFRIQLIKGECQNGARIAHCPGLTTSMMRGSVKVDYAKMKQDALNLIAAFEGVDSVHITTPGGTDIVLYIGNRPFSTDIIVPPGQFGNLPAGEIFCAPHEDRGDGLIVVDGSIGDLGLSSFPIHIVVKKGRVSSITGEDTDRVAELERLLALDEGASMLGELGIGLNPLAKLTGNMLEDEKAGGTAHIAFGMNVNMPNGKNDSHTHRDVLFYKPTFNASYPDGTTKVIMQDGKIVK